MLKIKIIHLFDNRLWFFNSMNKKTEKVYLKLNLAQSIKQERNKISKKKKTKLLELIYILSWKVHFKQIISIYFIFLTNIVVD